MDFSHYPAQEPFNENMVAYHDYLIGRAEGLKPIEASYGSDPYQSLAIFPAERPDGRVLLFFHGGGWTNGYKEWMYFIAPALTERGITFVSGGYRLAPQHIFPAGLHDCRQALEWLHANIAQYGGDPEKLFVSGHSAGGHYAALLTVTQSASADSQAGDTARSMVKGCAPISGIFYFGDDSGMAVRPRFLGAPEANAENTASPMRHLHDGLPPFLLTVGEKDFPHLIRQSAEMKAALQKLGIATRSLELPGCNHFTASYAAGDQDGLWPTTFDEWSAGLV